MDATSLVRKEPELVQEVDRHNLNVFWLWTGAGLNSTLELPWVSGIGQFGFIHSPLVQRLYVGVQSSASFWPWVEGQADFWLYLCSKHQFIVSCFLGDFRYNTERHPLWGHHCPIERYWHSWGSQQWNQMVDTCAEPEQGLPCLVS